MTPEAFRRLALALPGTIESSHMNHPDFRVRGKVFASLDAPDVGWGMVSLTPKQQAEVIKKAPDAVRPSNGAWGLRGYTIIFLRSVKEDLVRDALQTAWNNTETKATTRKSRSKS